MINIAVQSISPYVERAQVAQADGSMPFPVADHAVDRVVSTCVLDLLSEADARQAIAEAYRVLIPGGRLCLVSLTYGVTLPSRIVGALWQQLFRLHAPLVGGCRPIRLSPLLAQDGWSVLYRNVLTQFVGCHPTRQPRHASKGTFDLRTGGD